MGFAARCGAPLQVELLAFVWGHQGNTAQDPSPCAGLRCAGWFLDFTCTRRELLPGRVAEYLAPARHFVRSDFGRFGLGFIRLRA